MSDVREEMCRVIDELYRVGLITATGGNVSARSGAGDSAFITPRGTFKGALSAETLATMDLHGQALPHSPTPPSSEALIHAAVLRARPDVQAVVHCHAPYATILVNADLPFLPISTESAFLSGLGRIPFVEPGSDALAHAIVGALGREHAVLMQNHGLIVAAKSLRRAADFAQIIERTCQIIHGCYAVGRPPPALADELVAKLRAKPDLVA
jgi:ribulose-5-phosphate 4-epimerase/fuculose-1-phosphate aldolase